jgi:hypothetical protein
MTWHMNAVVPDTSVEVQPPFIEDRPLPPPRLDASGNREPIQSYLSFIHKTEKPYATTPIMEVDDYEYNMVFKNEGDRGITKKQRDALMSQYPMDWTVQPPSSDKFQKGMATYKESFQNPPPPNDIYNNGLKMMPPVDEEEILQTYTPKDPDSLTTYNAADAKELIQRIYDAKGLVAQYKQTGPNQYTILTTRPKDEEIVYEEDPAAPAAPASSSAVYEIGEDTIVVPTFENNGSDPFFTPSEKTRDGRWDYTSWTPGLERMFAPNSPRTNWY